MDISKSRELGSIHGTWPGRGHVELSISTVRDSPGLVYISLDQHYGWGTTGITGIFVRSELLSVLAAATLPEDDQ